MSNIKNLKFYGKDKPVLSHEEAQKNGSKGGKLSVKSRQEMKMLKDIFIDWGNKKPNDNLINTLSQFGIDCKNMSAIEALIAFSGLKLNEKRASVGDILKFIELYSKFTGQTPPDKTEITGSNGSPINPPIINILPVETNGTIKR